MHDLNMSGIDIVLIQYILIQVHISLKTMIKKSGIDLVNGTELN
jgi:hypothetical protein